MNERNVEALKVLIEKAKDAESDDYPPCETDWLARCLASMGVLVPSALTRAELEDIWYAASVIDDGREFARDDNMRERMDSIAKGEA